MKRGPAVQILQKTVPLEEPLLRMEMSGYGYRLLRIEPADR